MEGVMMKAPERIAIAVRRSDGQIEVKKQTLTTILNKYPILKLPVLRGIITFAETMVLGVRSLMTSAELYGEDAEEYKPSRFESFLAELQKWKRFERGRSAGPRGSWAHFASALLSARSGPIRLPGCQFYRSLSAWAYS